MHPAMDEIVPGSLLESKRAMKPIRKTVTKQKSSSCAAAGSRALRPLHFLTEPQIDSLAEWYGEFSVKYHINLILSSVTRYAQLIPD